MNNIEELREHCEEMIAISRMQYAYIPASSIITLIDRIEKAEKESKQWYSVVEAAISDDAEWRKQSNTASEAIGYLTTGIVMLKERAEKAEAALSAAQKELFDFHNQEFQQRLTNAEHQLYMKDLAIHNIKASRKAQFRKRLAAEAALSAANERIDELEINQVEQNDANSVLSAALDAANEKLKVPIKLPKKIYLKSSRGNVISWSKTFDAIEAAGFTVEGNE